MTRGAKGRGSQSQRAKFIKAARELGCEENEQAFDTGLKTVAKAKQPASKPDEPKG